jgi:hypothetical protein
MVNVKKMREWETSSPGEVCEFFPSFLQTTPEIYAHFAFTLVLHTLRRKGISWAHVDGRELQA